MTAGGNAVLGQQVALYGEPLAARFGRVLQAYRIPQSRLAQVIGLSAPMLSQLANAQRVKISNPAVFARLLRLEELARSPGVAAGDPAVLDAALTEVAASNPQLTTGSSDTRESALEHLARLASAHELDRAASAVPDSELATVLRDAARRAGA